MKDYSVTLVTCGSRDEADKIAGYLVEKKLAACVNIIPGLASVYRWKGCVEKAEEVLLVIKSRAELFDKLSQAVRQNHSYSCPEIISLPITKGSQPYLDWIRENTS